MTAEDVPGMPPTLQGRDARLPAGIDDPRAMMALTNKTNLKLQRAAAQMLGRLKRLTLFGEKRERWAEPADNLAVQLLFEMRRTIEDIEAIQDLGPEQRLARDKARLAGLDAMAKHHKAILGDVVQITHNTNKAMTDIAKVAVMQKKAHLSDDDFTDAELAS